ncbi:MAG: NAD(P)-dependent oxidoreductase [Parasporobacterium sp.]|nr:NAD(P)-dependent oxidoreductase [Parasporobacterium sp.]
MGSSIIVTGANGFVGSYVTGKLTSEGNMVFAVDKAERKETIASVRQIITDISDEANIDNCINEIGAADVMVHLAADISVPGNSETVGKNILGMISAVEIAKGVGAKQFVFLSSIPVIGDITSIPIDEKHGISPETPYHWSKYLCEMVLEKENNSFEQSTILRVPSPIGVGMRNNTYMSILIEKMFKDVDVEIYGSGSRVQNYIDVRDIAEAIYKAVNNKANGLFLIAGRESISNIDLAEKCKDIIGSKSKINVGKREDVSENERWIISYEKAAKEFAYEPKYSLDNSIRWIVESTDVGDTV